mmetsp:Transcript_32554/g.87394  ORF Transcript_32554/g.87394 Transcript_32554/m.87394 type:complete len:232 (+) Transcript_32554:439-1134(+)
MGDPLSCTPSQHSAWQWVLFKVSRCKPDTAPSAGPIITHVLLGFWDGHVNRPHPYQQRKSETPLDSSDSVNIPVTTTVCDTTANATTILRAWLAVAPTVVELQLPTTVLVRFGKRDRSAVIPVLGFRLLPQNFGTPAGSDHLIFLLDLSPAPPHRIELHVVCVRRVAMMVGPAYGRLVKCKRAKLRSHRVNDFLREPTESEEVGIAEIWLLVIPWPGQVVLVRVPDFVQLV